MSRQVVFPCPNCGASQSVDDSIVSMRCQFCGTTITVPAGLRGADQPPGAPYVSSSPAPAPPAPYYVPMMTPVVPDTNRIFRGVMGLNIFITLAVFAFTGCIILYVFVAIGLALVPGLFGLGQIFSQLTPH
jgi:hypothetical protein